MTTSGFLGIPEEYLWIVVLGFIIAFVLAFGIGANDVANSFGTSVGSKVLTLKQACILATIFETAGAVLLGAKVSETIRKGIIDTDYYVELNNNGTSTTGSQLLMIGQLSSLSGTCIWLLVATFFRVPVSGTHSIVGATVGFALVANAQTGVDWARLGLIVASWFISPLLSGGISIALFYFIKVFILTKPDALEPGLRFLPLIYSVTIAINVFSTVYEGPESLYFHVIPLWGAILASFGVGIICSILVKLVLIPWQRKRIIAELRDNPPEESVADAPSEAGSSVALSSHSDSTTQQRKAKYKPIESAEDEEPIQSEQQQGAKGAKLIIKARRRSLTDPSRLEFLLGCKF
ncbi:hypothetical protein BOX15_Mlig025555g1 [Macrostomum lignano]|uniref:Phosphate transporter n=1 Tax=Macrostomum lignano TaxID=282301 RepID=A0A267FTW8_9PLAT|nr:hypothetical protein BOX15_Mlig025555g1 [Macrostomum lignano]